MARNKEIHEQVLGICFCIPLVDPGSFRIWGLFTPPWSPQCGPKPFHMISAGIVVWLQSSGFYSIFILLWFDHLKSGYATETFMKEFGEEGGFCIPLLPPALDMRTRYKVHETDRIRNCIICLCYQVYFVGSRVPKSSTRGRDCHLCLPERAEHLHGCVYIYIYIYIYMCIYIYIYTHTHTYTHIAGLLMNVPELAVP